jgi:hypothetical protein
MTLLHELATRCERATGPDRELDALIRCEVFAPIGATVRLSPINGAWCIYEIGYGGKERAWEPRGLSQEQRLGAFTASLDAAMTLVPEGWRLVVDTATEEGVTLVDLWALPVATPKPERRHSKAATPALAVCAAAIRARAASAIDARSDATPKSGAARQGESAVAKRFAQKGSA